VATSVHGPKIRVCPSGKFQALALRSSRGNKFSGGGGAHAYPIERAAGDPFQSKQVNYHYLLVDVDGKQLTVTMNRLDLTSGKAVWTEPDSVKITAPAAAASAVADR
jgi:hypothetical protein